jgi:hypothetical protein
MSNALIYNYYEAGIAIPEEKGKIKYKCKVCVILNEKTKDNEPVYAKTIGCTTSNLIKHLSKESHSLQYQEYLDESKKAENLKLNSPLHLTKKRKLDFSPSSPTTPRTHALFNNVAVAPKYTFKSILQKARVFALVKMLVRLMLPVSIIESTAFKEFIAVFDPSLNVPTRETVKTSGMTNMYESVEKKIMNILATMTHVNISVDGWSDAVIRCYNGYIVQGIDSNWVMHTIPIAFQHVTGSHTGKAIK